MKKRLLIIPSVVILALVGALFLFSAFLNKTVETGVVTFVPQMTKTSVTLAEVSISPLTGGGKITGLKMGNPEGYDAPFSIELDEAEVQVSPISILGDRILIKRVYLRGPKFTYERKLLSSNLKDILKNVREASGRPPEEGEPTSEEAEVDTGDLKVEIESFIMEEGEVGMSVGGQVIRVLLPRIELRNIGTSKGGITPDEAAFEVMSVIFRQAITASAGAAGKGLDVIKNLFGGGKG